MRDFTAAEQALIDVWEAHTTAEFEQRDADAAVATMTQHPVLIHVPVGTGATGREPLRRFYREIFIPQIPPDAELEPVEPDGWAEWCDRQVRAPLHPHPANELVRPRDRADQAAPLLNPDTPANTLITKFA